MGFYILRFKKLVFIVLPLLFILTSAWTCGECGESIETFPVYFENKTNDTLYVEYFEYCDTDNILSPAAIFYYHDERMLKTVGPKCSFKFEGAIHWEKGKNEIMSRQFIVFKKSTLDKYSKRQIVEQNIFDKRLIFTYSDLERMNFTIEYDD